MINIIVAIIGIFGLFIFVGFGIEFWGRISDFGLFCYLILLVILLWSAIKLYKSDNMWYMWWSRTIFIIFSLLFGFAWFFLTADFFDGSDWFMIPIAILIFTFAYIYSNYYYSETAEEGLVENENEEFGEEEYEDEEKYEEEESFEEGYGGEEDLDRKYANILGLKGKVTFTNIKNSYKNKMKEYHPDKVANLGDKLKDVAEKESKLINEAYEYFKKKHS
ncbi:MAG: J domain-containing protein [Candidatus Marinimicrobia bacterium]|nr:J domain-containing protein [Candidatus Neomarinimicrobiota bacterium]